LTVTKLRYVTLRDNCLVRVAMTTLVNIFGGYRKSMTRTNRR